MMTRNVTHYGFMLVLSIGSALATGSLAFAAELSPGQQAVQTAAQQGQYSFVMFYRSNDAATQSVHQTLTTTLNQRSDSSIVPVWITDTKEKSLIDRFDATRLPMPAVAVLAPNGAVTTVFPQNVTPQQLEAAIVSKGQATCLKALQDRKIVLLCAHTDQNRSIPAGVQQFQADDLFKNRTQVVTLQAQDPEEQKFLSQLGLPTNSPGTVIAFMAPPGVMLGKFNENVSYDILAQKLAAAGKCCDDPNCKHHR